MLFSFFSLLLPLLCLASDQCSYSGMIPSKFLTECMSDNCKGYASLGEAQSKCCDFGTACGGVTSQSDGTYETRKGPTILGSPAAENTWIRTDGETETRVWPLPSTYSVSKESDLNLDQAAFVFTTSSPSSILASAIDRYTRIIFTHIPETTNPSNGLSGPVSELVITVVDSSEDTLGLGMDESYTLSIDGKADCILKANTVWGALRGLETFSQLVIYNFTAQYYQTYTSTISDAPRFSHRGILIDTARHFQPLNILYQILDSMSFAKFNVMHWHISDTQSFPLESFNYPKLWDGAYTLFERYSQNDVKQIVAYAKNLGIRVIPEFDMPGHAQSWCVGYPEVCPSPTCNSPLNPASNLTFELIGGLLDDASKLFPDSFVHLGGDEVNTNCWDKTPAVSDWMRQQGMTSTQTLEYFDEKAIQMVVDRQKIAIDWDEVFEYFNATLDPEKVVIEFWRGWDHVMWNAVLSSGFRAIYAPDSIWYLDQLGVSWQDRYVEDPYNSISNPDNQKYVLGGECCMWGETADASDVLQTIWPSAAAVAERLWSPRTVNSVELASPRFSHFRCLLNQRGIAAAPSKNTKEREPPTGPGSCYFQ